MAPFIMKNIRMNVTRLPNKNKFNEIEMCYTACRFAAQISAGFDKSPGSQENLWAGSIKG